MATLAPASRVRYRDHFRMASVAQWRGYSRTAARMFALIEADDKEAADELLEEITEKLERLGVV